jgi:hypothetical protein
MPRAFLKTRNKGGKHTYRCGVCGRDILPGEDYYTWKFNRGGRYWQHAEHGAPRRSQLTNSKMGEVYDAVDTFDISELTDAEDIKAALSSVANSARSVADEYEQSADSIEQAFPSGNSTSEACRATADELNDWADRLESWEPDYDEYDADQFDTEEDWHESTRESAWELVNEQPEYQG